MGKDKIISARGRGRLIVALDKPGPGDPLAWSSKLLEDLRGIACGVKVGLPLTLRIGINGLSELVKSYGRDYFWIADFKLADIGYVMKTIATELLDIGFDGVIAHAFVGAEAAINELKETVDSYDAALFLVVAMSHPGAREIMLPNMDKLIEVARKVKADGAVAPATMPEVVKKARSELGSEVIIISPGVGAQGAMPGAALAAGADYEIVGRAITAAPNPREAAEKIVEEQRKCLAKHG